MATERRAGKSRRSTGARPDDVAPSPPTLARVIENLGPEVVELLAAPHGLDVPVAEIVIHDPVGGTPVAANDLVLGVGAGPGLDRATSVVLEGAECGASAVALKLDEHASGPLTEIANESGVALLRVPPELRWDQLYTLIRTSIASSGEPAAGAVGAVPVGDLFALANAVAAMVGGPVTIEDPQSRVLAYSSLDEPVDEPRRQTILGRRIPEPWMKRIRQAGVFERMWSTDEVVRFDGWESEGLRPRIVTAVRAGGEVLGSIWVQEGSRPLTASDEAALREASRIAALHLIRHRTGRDIERRMRGDALRSILEGRGPVDVVASRLSLPVGGCYTVVAFESDSADEADTAVRTERLTDIVSLYSEAFDRRAVAATIGRTVYGLLPSGESTGRTRLVGVANEAVTRARTTLKVGVRAGVGSTVNDLRSVPHSRWEADQILRVLAAGHPCEVGDIEDLRPHTILVELRDMASDRPHLRLGKVGVLVEHDRVHGTDYVATLRAYLDSFGDIPAASARIGVHPNTFRYRIRRLAELSRLSLDEPEERLVAELQLRLL
ncbi:MAG TPA: helix-turn-helix domain-containing protein [Actinomycetota bacterium]|nr:helix-turn-helix domain-containing protein [Actinomycetota bacterium]